MREEVDMEDDTGTAGVAAGAPPEVTSTGGVRLPARVNTAPPQAEEEKVPGGE